MRKNEGSPLLLKAHIEATTDKFVKKKQKNNYFFHDVVEKTEERYSGPWFIISLMPPCTDGEGSQLLSFSLIIDFTVADYLI